MVPGYITIKSKSGNKEWFNICLYNDINSNIINHSLISQSVNYQVDNNPWETFSVPYNSYLTRKVVYGYQVTLSNYEQSIDQNNFAYNEVDNNYGKFSLASNEEYDIFGDVFMDNLVGIEINELDDMTAQELLNEIELLRNEILSIKNSLNSYVNVNTINLYATKEYIDSQHYLTEHQSLDRYITQDVLSGNSYISQVQLANSSYVSQELLSFNSYVTQNSLSNNSYITQQALSANSYITQFNLSNNSYITQQSLSANSYLTRNALINCGYITINDVPKVDLSSYVTKEILSNCGYITVEDVEGIIGNEVNLNDYASQDWVETQINNIDLSDYATESFVVNKVENIDLSDYATESFVINKVENIDLSDYATESFVVNKVENIDLSDYATKNDLSTSINNLINGKISEIESSLNNMVANEENVIDFLLPIGENSTTIQEPSFNYVTNTVNEYSANINIAFSVKTNCRYYISIEVDNDTHNAITFNSVNINGSEVKTSNTIGEYLFSSTQGQSKTMTLSFTVSNYTDTNSSDLFTESTITVLVTPEDNAQGTQYGTHTVKYWNNYCFVEQNISDTLYFNGTENNYTAQVASTAETVTVPFTTTAETITCVLNDVTYNYSAANDAMYINWIKTITISGSKDSVTVTFNPITGYLWKNVTTPRIGTLKFKNGSGQIIAQLNISQQPYYFSHGYSCAYNHLHADQTAFKIYYITNIPGEKISISVTNTTSNTAVSTTESVASDKKIVTVNCGANQSTSNSIQYTIQISLPNRADMSNTLTSYFNKTITHLPNQAEYIYFGDANLSDSQIIANGLTEITFPELDWDDYFSEYDITGNFPQYKAVTNINGEDLGGNSGTSIPKNSSGILTLSAGENLTAQARTWSTILRVPDHSNENVMDNYVEPVPEENRTILAKIHMSQKAYPGPQGYVYHECYMWVENENQTEYTVNVSSAGETKYINILTNFRRQTLQSDRGLIPIKINPMNYWVTPSLVKEYAILNPPTKLVLDVSANTTGSQRTCNVEIRTLTNTVGGIDYSEANQTVRVTIHVIQSA